MILFYLVVLVLYLILFICSHKESIDKEWITNKYTKIFMKMACFLYKKSLRFSKKKGKEIVLFFQKKQVMDDLKSLNPTESAKRQETKFYLEKMSMVLIIILMGDFIALCSALSSLCSTSIRDGNYINRNSYGEGSKEVTLIASVGDREIEEKMDVVVNERKYDKIEINKIMEEIIGKLPNSILSNNESLELVKSDLNLRTSLKGYLVDISWESSNYSIINSEGHIETEEIEPQGELVLLTAVLTYFNEKVEHSFYIRVFPPNKSPRELLAIQLTNTLSKTDKSSENSGKYLLPESLVNEQIIWSEKKVDSSGILIVMTIVASITLFIGKDHELHKRVLLRNKQLSLDYPEMVSKLSLLMCSGMTIRGAWKKMAYDYKEQLNKEAKKKYVYEEMLLTCYEMESGVSELMAYTNFGKRCGEQRYMKFSSLITQNLKKGSARLINMLKEESKEAFEERKSIAKRLGEEAGTKLLMPMILMLFIVMIIIIVPAFLSFSI